MYCKKRKDAALQLTASDNCPTKNIGCLRKCACIVKMIFPCLLQEHPSGSIYNYVLSTETCLGPLTYLRVWHDNSGNGKNKGWYLDQFMIVDMQTGEK